MTGLSRIAQWRLGLDPGRSARRFRHYDALGFDRWHEQCRAARQGPVDLDHPVRRTLAEQGVALLDVVAPAAAAALLDQLQRLPVLPRRGGDIEWAEDFDVTDRATAHTVLPQLLTPAIVAAVRSQLESEFMVYWWSAARTLPRTPSTRSMLWHCDTGPSRHLKLLVYLEDAAASGGNTHFIMRSASDRLLDSGYTFGRTSRRRHDLGPLARRLGFDDRIVEFPIRAGQGVLFEPTRTLHRGVVPSLGFRHVVTLCLLPSPVPWQAVLAEAGLPGEPEKIWPSGPDPIARQLAPLLARRGGEARGELTARQ